MLITVCCTRCAFCCPKAILREDIGGSVGGKTYLQRPPQVLRLLRIGATDVSVSGTFSRSYCGSSTLSFVVSARIGTLCVEFKLFSSFICLSSAFCASSREGTLVGFASASEISIVERTFRRNGVSFHVLFTLYCSCRILSVKCFAKCWQRCLGSFSLVSFAFNVYSIPAYAQVKSSSNGLWMSIWSSRRNSCG